MTIRKTLTLSITDIKSLEVRCTQCAGVVFYPLEYAIPNFLNCPGCGQNLINNGPNDKRYTALFSLQGALVSWNRIAGKPLDITFTVDLP